MPYYRIPELIAAFIVNICEYSVIIIYIYQCMDRSFRLNRELVSIKT